MQNQHKPPRAGRSRMLTALGLLGACGVSAAAVGCSSYATETHYFRTTDTNGDPSYFRLVVTSSSTLASSRFVSGYFDEQAVDQYFSEIKQPTGGKFPGAGTPANPSSERASREPTTDVVAEGAARVEPLDPSLRGRKLVLLMSSNSDAIASGIGAISDGKEISGLVQALVSKEKSKEAAEASVALQSQTNSAEVFKTLGETSLTADRLKADTPAEAAIARQNVLAIVNKLASMLGATQQFDDFDQADRWLRANRARIEKE